jgi:hypothetical protein
MKEIIKEEVEGLEKRYMYVHYVKKNLVQGLRFRNTSVLTMHINEVSARFI